MHINSLHPISGKDHINTGLDGLVQDCSISSALALEILQSYTQPSTCLSPNQFSSGKINTTDMFPCVAIDTLPEGFHGSIGRLVGVNTLLYKAVESECGKVAPVCWTQLLNLAVQGLLHIHQHLGNLAHLGKRSHTLLRGTLNRK